MLLDEISEELDQLKNAQLFRSRNNIDAVNNSKVLIDGNWLLNFSSNDYLGISQNKVVKSSIINSLRKYGNGSGASHLISGHFTPHNNLEIEAAKMIKMEKSLFFSTGYMANLAVIGSLGNRNSVIFSDKLNHASLNEAAILCRGKLVRYHHLDLNHLETQIKNNLTKRKIIVTDGVFSMDGDIADIPGLVYLCKKYDATLYVDDAHGYGVLGSNGQGILEYYEDQELITKESKDSIIYMFTLGKSIGVSGALICGKKEVIEYCIQKSKSYIYTTASAPYIASGVISSMNLIRKDTKRREKLKSLIELFRSKIINKSALTPSMTPIQPIIINNLKKAISVSSQLRALGFLVPVIRPPTVPAGTSRLRISISALHSKKDIIILTSVINRLLSE
ncbi:MAG: 8-amino-7-oxononanoate synthase [Methylophilaceae bacterium]|nr:8-amino-7-oxononanoate synthase [Methylophilaceae bacterium]